MFNQRGTGSKIGNYIAFKSNSGFLTIKQILLKTPIRTFVTSVCLNHDISMSVIILASPSNQCLLFVLCLILTFLALILWMSLSNPNVSKGRIGTFTDEAKLRIRPHCQGGSDDESKREKVRSLDFKIHFKPTSNCFHNFPPMTLTGPLSVTQIASRWNTELPLSWRR